MPTRPATPADYERALRFMAELGLPPDDPLPSRATWEAEWLSTTFFVEQGGAPAGYAVLRVLDGVGYVFHVVTDPAFRRRGVGAALMDACAERLRAAGCARWMLNVRVDNTPAIRLYERFGMKPAHRSTAMALDWALVAGLPRDETAVSARVVAAPEDAALEAAFAIPRGRLADLRGRPGRVIVRLVDEARPDDLRVGVACFDPAFPGAYPFQVARPTLAAPLLDAIRAHARPGDTYVRLMIEGDAALDAMLRAAGAAVRLEIVHMEGEVPPAR